MVEASEDIRPLYRAMLGLGAVAVVILALGLATVLRYAPPGQHTGYRPRVVGVFPYDPGTGRPTGPPAVRFRRDQPFAAQVDWAALPAATTVSASWTDSLDDQVGAVGPASAGSLAGREVLVPVHTPPEFRANLPGRYTLTVVRYARGQPVELLASASVVVLTSP